MNDTLIVVGFNNLAMNDGRYRAYPQKMQNGRRYYVVHGPRGSWNLYPNQYNPHQFFVEPKSGRPGTIRGVEWFQEDFDAGTLIAIR